MCYDDKSVKCESDIRACTEKVLTPDAEEHEGSGGMNR